MANWQMPPVQHPITFKSGIVTEPWHLWFLNRLKPYIDDLVSGSDLDFAGDTGTGSVDLDSQTFTLSGTANEVETVASNQTITIGLPDSVTITNLTVTTLDLGLTEGSVVFAGASGLAEDNDNFFWDDSNNRLGLGISTPSHPLHIYTEESTILAIESAGVEQHAELQLININETWKIRATGDADELVIYNDSTEVFHIDLVRGTYIDTGYLSVETSNRGLYVFGVGDLDAALTGGNTEYTRYYHDGTWSHIDSGSTGTGTATSISFEIDGAVAAFIGTDKKLRLNNGMYSQKGTDTYTGQFIETDDSKDSIVFINHDNLNHAILRIQTKATKTTADPMVQWRIDTGVSTTEYFSMGINNDVNDVLTIVHGTDLDTEKIAWFDSNYSSFFEGVIWSKERAAALTNVAGYNQIWTKDDNPTTLWFTDDTGNNTQLGLNTGTPAGSDHQVQFNDNGAFGASANLTHDGTDTRIAADTKLYFNT